MNKEAKVMRQDALWNMMKYACSFLAVMVIGSLLILWQGENPATAMKYILQGAFGSIRNFGNTLRWITPCILTGIAATIAFKDSFTLGHTRQPCSAFTCTCQKRCMSRAVFWQPALRACCLH